MPIYEYRCRDCGKVSELLVGVTGSRQPKCSHCGSERMEKILSVPASVRVKKSASPSSSECCGMTNPCHDPKRCCTR
ncbi:MAG: zinc ribbon domain-containing protein [Acidobacteriota bacterium]